MVYRDLTQPSYSEDFYGASLAKIDGTAYCRFAKIDFREGRALVSEIYSALLPLFSLFLHLYLQLLSFSKENGRLPFLAGKAHKGGRAMWKQLINHHSRTSFISVPSNGEQYCDRS